MTNDDHTTASHADRLSLVLDEAKQRCEQIESELRTAFADHLESRQTEWIMFGQISADELAKIFSAHPIVLKPVTAACNIASRAIRRDLGFEVATYTPKLSEAQANQLAGYVRPFLPDALALPALVALDDWFFRDKELRKSRGHWERVITAALTLRSGREFKKRLFSVPGADGKPMKFELDAASPSTGAEIKFGVDVKGISHPRDFHKRGDEIVNKAEKFKSVFPNGKFGAVIHYPFLDSRDNVVQRLSVDAIDAIVFAGDDKSTIDDAVIVLLKTFGLSIVESPETQSLFDQIRDS